MLPVLVSCLDPSHIEGWAFAEERVPPPFLALREPVPVREALVRGLAAFPGATVVCYAQPEFLTAFFSVDYLYEGALHRWLQQASAQPVVFRRIESGGPADLLAVPAASLHLADAMAPSTHEGEIELDLLRADDRPKTLVFGDSHVFNLYTSTPLIGMRGVVVEPIEVNGRTELKVCRHIGPVTMHRLASRGELTADFFRRYGLRPGDRVVAVCGEIDVRNHVGRIAAAKRLPTVEVVEELCGRFCEALARAVAEFGELQVVLSCPTPPMDYAQLDPSKVVEHHGTLEERLASTADMRRCLTHDARARGWTTLDVAAEFADARGALDLERSDHFCHVAHAHKGPALAALHRVMEGMA